MFPLASKNSICFWFYISILSFWLPALPVCTSWCAIFWFCRCTSFMVVCQQLTNSLTHSNTAYISLQPEFPTFQQSGTLSQKFLFFYSISFFLFWTAGGCFENLAFRLLVSSRWNHLDSTCLHGCSNHSCILSFCARLSWAENISELPHIYSNMLILNVYLNEQLKFQNK